MKVLFLLMALLFPIATSAQSHDASVWVVNEKGNGTDIVPWYVYTTGSSLVFDFRYNFDIKDALTATIGYEIGSDKISIVPSIGYISGDFGGPVVQLYASYYGERDGLFTMTEYADNEEYDFTYFYFAYSHSLSERFSIGIDGEDFQDSDEEKYTLLGPTLKLNIGKSGSYFKVWPAFSKDGYDSTTVALGFVK